ncbi:MAG: serine hydroxymethyltransferase [Candidatus Eremiobacteraeota bacterium]|nr:serine hydroxymethyltransferase [Candidatus Eremiobacteraeota bacterium]MCW5871246.1 serine hydroxymethyltransferase [Candidatus Eremiobacteraeota bacterium]
MLEHVVASDPEVARAIQAETLRQTGTLEMIASENFVSEAVLEAVGSVLTNKYAEGYPGKRYYGGCEHVDVVEELARQRACKLFGAEHANVQPHSGSSANIAAYYGIMQHGDKLMGLSLAHGGHLTHGHKVNFSGSHFEIIHYQVKPDTELIDYDQVAELARQHRPKVLLAGYSAYPRTLDFEFFRKLADEVGAIFMVDMAHFAGLAAVGLHPNPVQFADVVTTTTHKTLRGPRGGMILCKEAFAKAIDKNIFPGYQGGPLMHVIAGKAVAFQEALQPDFRTYQEQVVKNARQLASTLSEGGARLVTGGTDNHLMLVDVTPLGLTGRDAEAALEHAGVTCNKNAIPFDKNPPAVCSGVRLGTPALTTRGMKEEQMKQIGLWIVEALQHAQDSSRLDKIRGQVGELCRQHPLYASRAQAALAAART